MLGSVFRPGTQAGLLVLNLPLMCCMTLGKRLLLKEGGGLDPSQGTLSTLQINPIHWRSLWGIGNREKGNVLSFLLSFFFFLLWLCLNMNVITKRFRRACALDGLCQLFWSLGIFLLGRVCFFFFFFFFQLKAMAFYSTSKSIKRVLGHPWSNSKTRSVCVSLFETL